MRPRYIAAMLGAWLICGASFADGVKFDIASQPVSDALNEFARQSGLQVVIDWRDSSGVVTSPLVGDFTPQAALARLLSGTGLAYEFLNERTVAVRPKSQQNPVSGTEKAAERPMGEQLRLAQSQARAEGAAQESKADSAAQEEEESARRSPQEVVVTATKRAQAVQDVPVSISVLTSEDISRRGLVDAEDYLRSIPGVNQMEGAQGQTIVIRGIEASVHDPNYFAGTTTATYFGETPTTNSAGLGQGSTVDIKLVDIERVEVLRGPQGTAFGNSSLGGAIRTIPVAPKLDRFEGRVGAGFSTTSGTGGDNYSAQAIANIPLVRDKLAVRAVAYTFDESGYYRNRAASDPGLQAAIIVPYGAQAYASNDDDVGAYNVVGGRIAALFKPTDDLSFTLTYLTQSAETTGWAMANSGNWQQSVLRVAPEHMFRGESLPISDLDIDLGNAVVEYDLGWASLTGSYSHVESGGEYSYHATIYPLFRQAYSLGQPSDHTENVGELRIATKFSGNWNFLAGLYAEKLDDTTFFSAYWTGDPALDFYLPGQRFLGDWLVRRNQRQKAAFGEVSWQFLPGLTLTGGVRAYDYERVNRDDSQGRLYSVRHEKVEADASGTTFRGNLSYKPADNALLYATWSQGFRIGRPQSGLAPGLCDLDNNGIVDGTTDLTIASTRVTQSDEVDNYELGGKFALLDRRLAIDIDVFRIDWSDIPVTARGGTCGSPYNANAGVARSEGIEFQANFQVTDAFRIDAGASKINGKLTEDAPGLGARAGARLPGSPQFNANLGLQYEFRIAGRAAYVRADSMYADSFYGDLLQSALTKSGGYVKVDTSARVSFSNLDIDLYVRNVTNEDAATYRGAFNIGPFFAYRLRPRTLGVQLSYDFR